MAEGSATTPNLPFPVECRRCEIGGGRGVFASVDLPAGTVVLEEEPLLQVRGHEVQPGENWHAAVARRLLQARSNASEASLAQRLLGTWHPQNLFQLPPGILEEARKSLGSTAAALAKTQKVDQDEALVVLLQVQMNAFESGLYVDLALVNHSCFPNCLKFGPGQRRESSSQSWCPKSEIVAVRDIRAGEEVTISFLGCLERSAKRRAQLFRRQHLVELVQNKDVASMSEELEALRPEAGTSTSLEELESWLEAEEAEEVTGNLTMPAQQLLLQLLEKQREAEAILSSRHLVLCRLQRRLARAARVALEEAMRGSGTKNAQALLAADIAEVLVRTSFQVRLTQPLYLATTHLQRADDAENLAAGIATLISCDRERLFENFKEEFPDFSAASTAEAQLLQEAAAVRALYKAKEAAETEAKKPQAPDSATKAPKMVSGPSPGQAPADWSIFD